MKELAIGIRTPVPLFSMTNVAGVYSGAVEPGRVGEVASKLHNQLRSIGRDYGIYVEEGMPPVIIFAIPPNLKETPQEKN